MTIQRKKIETFQIVLETENNFTFADIITSNDVKGNEVRVKGKNIELNILVNNRNVIVGLVETNRNDNIPPKKNRRNKRIGPIGLSTDEGLAYANVFIYEKKRRILMYEVNKFGCFVDHFVEYIHRCCEDSNTFVGFNIKLNTVLKSNEYQRMINMRFHKSLELKFANPTEILKDYTHKNDAIWNACNSAADIHSKKVQTKFEVSARGHSNGLASRTVRSIVDRALELLRGANGENVEKLEVIGYESDSDDDRLIPIDLIADRYIKYIRLDEPRENSDLLQRQRQEQIIELYDSCVSDFDTIFGR